MTEFKFACPICGQHFRGDARYVGTAITCPTCQREFVVQDPKVTTSLRVEGDRWVPPPKHAHSAPTAAPRLVTLTPTATRPLPPPTPPAPPPAPAKTSGLAIASFVLALLSPALSVFGFIPGITLGHLARARIAKDSGLKGKGLALAGLIIGYVVLALNVLGILVFLLFVWRLRAGLPH
jgi:hypothetical protein